MIGADRAYRAEVETERPARASGRSAVRAHYALAIARIDTLSPDKPTQGVTT